MGWAYAGVVWVYSLVCFLIQDCVKQLAYRTSSCLRVSVSSCLCVFVWCDRDQTKRCDRDDGEKRWVEPQPSSPTSHVPLSHTLSVSLLSRPPLPPSSSPLRFSLPLLPVVFDFRTPSAAMAKKKDMQMKRANRARADTCQPRMSEDKQKMSRELSSSSRVLSASLSNRSLTTSQVRGRRARRDY